MPVDLGSAKGSIELDVKSVEGSLAKLVELSEQTVKQLENLNASLTSVETSVGPASEAVEGFNIAQGQLIRTLETVGQSLERTGQALTNAITKPLLGAIEASSEFEDAFFDVEQALEGTGVAIDEVQDSIRRMATDVDSVTSAIPNAHIELTKVAAIAGRLGADSKEDVERFTDTVAKFSVATGIAADRAAHDLGQFATATGTATSDIDRVGSVIAALDDKFNTTSQAILDSSQTLAGMGRQLGFTQAEILGLATALGHIGVEGTRGGMAVARALNQISIAALGPRGALERLADQAGLTFDQALDAVTTGGQALEDFASVVGMSGNELVGSLEKSQDQLQHFARIAGVSADEFARKFKEKPSEAFALFIQGLDRIQKAGGNVSAELASVGLSSIRVADVLSRLAINGDEVAQAMQTANQAWADNTALTDEAAAKGDKAKAEFEKIKNVVADLGLTLGDSLLPALRDVIDAVAPAIKSFAGWFRSLNETNPALAKLIVVVLALAAALGPVLLVLGTIVTGIAGFVGAISFAGGAIASVLAGIGSAVLAVGGAIAGIAGAIGAPILIIIGLVVGLFLAIQNNWFGIRDALQSAWLGIQGFFASLGQLFSGENISRNLNALREEWDRAWTSLGDSISQFGANISRAWEEFKLSIFTSVSNFLFSVQLAWQSAWNSVVSFFSGIGQSILDTINNIVGGILDAFNQDWIGIGLGIINGIVDGVLSAAGSLIDAVISAAQSALDSVASFLGIGSPSRVYARQIGLPMAQGIAQGFAKGVKTYGPQIQRSLKNLAKQIEPQPLPVTIEANGDPVEDWIGKFQDSITWEGLPEPQPAGTLGDQTQLLKAIGDLIDALRDLERAIRSAEGGLRGTTARALAGAGARIAQAASTLIAQIRQALSTGDWSGVEERFREAGQNLPKEVQDAIQRGDWAALQRELQKRGDQIPKALFDALAAGAKANSALASDSMFQAIKRGLETGDWSGVSADVAAWAQSMPESLRNAFASGDWALIKSELARNAAAVPATVFDTLMKTEEQLKAAGGRAGAAAGSGISKSLLQQLTQTEGEARVLTNRVVTSLQHALQTGDWSGLSEAARRAAEGIPEGLRQALQAGDPEKIKAELERSLQKLPLDLQKAITSGEWGTLGDPLVAKVNAFTAKIKKAFGTSAAELPDIQADLVANYDKIPQRLLDALASDNWDQAGEAGRDAVSHLITNLHAAIQAGDWDRVNQLAHDRVSETGQVVLASFVEDSNWAKAQGIAAQNVRNLGDFLLDAINMGSWSEVAKIYRQRGQEIPQGLKEAFESSDWAAALQASKVPIDILKGELIGAFNSGDWALIAGIAEGDIQAINAALVTEGPALPPPAVITNLTEVREGVRTEVERPEWSEAARFAHRNIAQIAEAIDQGARDPRFEAAPDAVTQALADVPVVVYDELVDPQWEENARLAQEQMAKFASGLNAGLVETGGIEGAGAAAANALGNTPAEIHAALTSPAWAQAQAEAETTGAAIVAAISTGLDQTADFRDSFEGIAEVATTSLTEVANVSTASLKQAGDENAAFLIGLQANWQVALAQVLLQVTTASLNLQLLNTALVFALSLTHMTFLTNLETAWRESWQHIIDWMLQVRATLLQITGETVTGMVTALLTQPWPQIGQSITDGIVAGIQAGAQRIIAAAQEAALAAFNAAKAALGIGSPSKLFEEQIGRAMAEGLALGFHEGMIAVSPTIIRALDTAVPAITPIRPAEPSVPIPAGFGREAGGTAKVVVEKIEINNPTPEPASDSIQKTMHKLAFLGVTG